MEVGNGSGQMIEKEENNGFDGGFWWEKIGGNSAGIQLMQHDKQEYLWDLCTKFDLQHLPL